MRCSNICRMAAKIEGSAALHYTCILPGGVRLFVARGFVTDIDDLVATDRDVPAPEGDDLHFLSAMGTFLRGHAFSLLILFVGLMSCRTKNQSTTDHRRTCCRFNNQKIWVSLPYKGDYPCRDPI